MNIKWNQEQCEKCAYVVERSENLTLWQKHYLGLNQNSERNNYECLETKKTEAIEIIKNFEIWRVKNIIMKAFLKANINHISDGGKKMNKFEKIETCLNKVVKEIMEKSQDNKK